MLPRLWYAPHSKGGPYVKRRTRIAAGRPFGAHPGGGFGARFGLSAARRALSRLAPEPGAFRTRDEDGRKAGRAPSPTGLRSRHGSRWNGRGRRDAKWQWADG